MHDCLRKASINQDLVTVGSQALQGLEIAAVNDLKVNHI